jgi:DNA-binding transcriptional LysR family regulator
LNQRQIEAFRSIIMGGTTIRAAEILGISQPAVSKAIQELERSIGFKLFERVSGRLLPTPEGQLLYRDVERSFVGLAEIRSAAARIRDFGVGELRIGCLSAFSTNILPAALFQFRQRHPDVAITFQVQSSPRLRDTVAAGEFDLAITSDEVDTTGTIAEPFIDTVAEIAFYPGHPLADLDVVHIRDLDRAAFVALAPEDTTRQEADSHFRAAGAAPQVVVETPFSSTVCALVLAGLGCGIVDPVTATGFRERGLILRQLEPQIRFRTLLLFPPQRQMSTNVRTFLEVLRHEGNAATRAR